MAVDLAARWPVGVVRLVIVLLEARVDSGPLDRVLPEDVDVDDGVLRLAAAVIALDFEGDFDEALRADDLVDLFVVVLLAASFA